MSNIVTQQHTSQPIQLTDAAARHIATKINTTENAIGFRLSVEDAGCNSKKYVTDYVTITAEDDIQFIDHDITIVLRKKDLLFIAGTEVDYVQDGINKVLKYNNPNVTTACGCGESFNIEEKDDD